MQAISDTTMGVRRQPRFSIDACQSEHTQPEATRQQDEYPLEQAAHFRGVRRKRFLSLCPPLYQETDSSRLPHNQINAVLAWRYGSRSLVLTGMPGTGKTRSAWLLVQRLIMQENRFVRYFDSLSWAMAISAASNNLEDSADWFDGVCRVDVLFLDGLDWPQIDEQKDRIVSGIFERRAAHLKPIIATMDYPQAPAPFMAVLSQRMKGNVQIVTF